MNTPKRAFINNVFCCSNIYDDLWYLSVRKVRKIVFCIFVISDGYFRISRKPKLRSCFRTTWYGTNSKLAPRVRDCKGPCNTARGSHRLAEAFNSTLFPAVSHHTLCFGYLKVSLKEKQKWYETLLCICRYSQIMLIAYQTLRDIFAITSNKVVSGLRFHSHFSHLGEGPGCGRNEIWVHLMNKNNF